MKPIVATLVERRIAELRQDIVALQAELSRTTTKGRPHPPQEKVRRPLTRAQRTAISRRMKAYWRAKRTAK